MTRPDKLRISRIVLAKRLTEIRDLHGLSRSDVDSISQHLISEISNRLHQIEGQDSHHFPSRFSSLENALEGEIEIDLELFDAIADAYGVPRLMLYPLLSQETSGNMLVLRHTDRKSAESEIAEGKDVGFFLAPIGWDAHRQQQGDRLDGTYQNAVYEFPSKRLSNADDTAFVLLKLGPKGVSDCHAHLGDELAYCVQGQVELRFQDTGGRNVLNPNDIAHFYSERTHSMHNVSDTEEAWVFIIRFYPTDGGSRHKIVQAMQDEFKFWTSRLSTQATEALSRSYCIDPYLTAYGTRTPQTEKNKKNDQVADRRGLGRLLQSTLDVTALWRDPQESTLDALGKKADEMWKSLKIPGLKPMNRSRLDRVYHGEAAIQVEELEPLARLHHIQPILLLNYLVPAVANGIVVRSSQDDLEKDWILRNEAPVQQGVEYRIPCRRLADSDISLARVKLEPGAATPENFHGGFEVLWPLSGEITVEVQGQSREIRAASHLPRNKTTTASLPHTCDLIHFRSHYKHQVRNLGHEPAEFLAIRFLK